MLTITISTITLYIFLFSRKLRLCTYELIWLFYFFDIFYNRYLSFSLFLTLKFGYEFLDIYFENMKSQVK